MPQRIDQPQQLPGPLVAQLRQRHDRPDRGVGVLAAVLAHAGHIALDVARLMIEMVERRIKQLDQSGVAADQPTVDRVQGRRPAVSVAGAGKDRPALRQRIDLTFAVRGRTRGRAVVEIGPQIPVAVPRVLLDVAAQRGRGGLKVLDGRQVAAAAGNLGKLPQHVVQEECQPDAFAFALTPTRFMPSFQSPQPISGNPCSPKRRPCSIARRQCS